MLAFPGDGFVKDQVFEMFVAVGELLSNAYRDLLLETIKLMIIYGLPSVETIRGQWFSTALGGTFGLASRVMTLVAVIVALWVTLTVTKNHGKRLSRLITTMVMLGLMAPLFYPVYALLVSLSRGLSIGALNLGRGSDGNSSELASALADIALPVNILGVIFVAFVGMVISAVLVAEVFALNIWMLFILLFYPLSIALRPVHQAFNNIFNALNSGIVTILFSVPLMSFCLVFAIFGIEYIPGGDTVIGAIVLTLIGGIIAMFVPPLLAWFLYQKSSEIFGNTEAAMSGALDINSMPPMTSDDMRDSVDDNHGSALSAFAKTAGAGILGGQVLGGNNTMQEIRHYATDGAAAAATVAGHPWVAAGIKARQAYSNDKASQEGDDE